MYYPCNPDPTFTYYETGYGTLENQYPSEDHKKSPLHYFRNGVKEGNGLCHGFKLLPKMFAKHVYAFRVRAIPEGIPHDDFKNKKMTPVIFSHGLMMN